MGLHGGWGGGVLPNVPPFLPHPEPVLSGYKERTGLNMERECGRRVILAVMFLKYFGVDSVHMCEVKFNAYLRSR